VPIAGHGRWEAVRMIEDYRVEHHPANGASTVLLFTTSRTNAVASAASWAWLLRQRERAGAVVVIDSRTGVAVHTIPLAEDE
jgi:hypothetical protein